MSQQDAFDRILTSLHEAALDDTRWPVASRLIDEACGTKGNTLIVGQGPDDDVRVSYVGLYWRGERHEEIEREYLTTYHPLDERIARLRQLPDSRVVPRPRPLQRQGIEDLPDVQRVLAPFQRPERPERSPAPVA